MKKIELIKIRVGDLKYEFGNPRKINKKKKEELKKSIEMFGDFGMFLIDEKNNVIAGNQRSKILCEINPDTMIDAKRLIGYSESELKAINIKDNTHAGEWDLDMLADWSADLQIDLSDITQEKEPSDRKITDMELIRFEKYDYVMIVCRNEQDYHNLQLALGLDKKRVLIAGKRRIKARAIWYDEMKAKIVKND